MTRPFFSFDSSLGSHRDFHEKPSWMPLATQAEYNHQTFLVNMNFDSFPEAHKTIQACFPIAKSTGTSHYVVWCNYPLILFSVTVSPSFPIADVKLTGKW